MREPESEWEYLHCANYMQIECSVWIYKIDDNNKSNNNGYYKRFKMSTNTHHSHTNKLARFVGSCRGFLEPRTQRQRKKRHRKWIFLWKNCVNIFCYLMILKLCSKTNSRVKFLFDFLLNKKKLWVMERGTKVNGWVFPSTAPFSIRVCRFWCMFGECCFFLSLAGFRSRTLIHTTRITWLEIFELSANVIWARACEKRLNLSVTSAYWR